MGTAEFPMERIQSIMGVSFLAWWGVSLCAHLLSTLCWRRYAGLSRADRLQWCNKIACGLHAAILAPAQARSLFDPVLLADPLHAVTEAHFFWASVLAGYLAYDTLYCLVFFDSRRGAAFLAHHVIGLAGCALGLLWNKLALFGAAIEVLFECTTPLLQTLGCMKIAGLGGGAAYARLGRAFAAQFFLCRVLGGAYYLQYLVRLSLGPPAAPWWAWAGVAVFGALNALNLFWCWKLVGMALAGRAKGRAAKGVAAAAPAGGEGNGSQASGGVVKSGAVRRPVVEIRAAAGARR